VADTYGGKLNAGATGLAPTVAAQVSFSSTKTSSVYDQGNLVLFLGLF
jgi:hypothetical protein